MTIESFEMAMLDGSRKSLGDYAGKVLLIVNTASKCGFTPQYAGLENLYRKYRDHGLVVLGFPCNQFGGQEPGDAAQISRFCSLHYDVSFPMFARIDVNGKDAAPLYEYLKGQAPGILGSETIKWNFTKFLLDRNGAVVRRYASMDTPESLQADIEHLLEPD